MTLVTLAVSDIGGVLRSGAMTLEAGGEVTPESWRALLDERVGQVTEAFSAISGVCGLVLAGSLGRGEPWPLSDIDLVILYDDELAGQAASELEARRHDLLDWWTGEGVGTSIDAGKLAFRRAEVEQALGLSLADATKLLGDARWFHSLDKAYEGRAVYDTKGLATALASWLTDVRFDPDVVRDRIAAHGYQVLTHLDMAEKAQLNGVCTRAGLALRESLHALMRYLMEGWGERDNSFGRFGTRFERAAAARGEVHLLQEVMSLYNLSPGAVARRMDTAPQGIKHRHALSLRAWRLVGEEVTAIQDARDVLLSFATYEVRYRKPPFGAWVGLDLTPAAAAVEERLGRQRQLVNDLAL